MTLDRSTPTRKPASSANSISTENGGSRPGRRRRPSSIRRPAADRRGRAGNDEDVDRAVAAARRAFPAFAARRLPRRIALLDRIHG